MTDYILVIDYGNGHIHKMFITLEEYNKRKEYHEKNGFKVFLYEVVKDHE